MSSYDLVLEVSEDFLNRSLDTFYKENIFPHEFSGEHGLNIPLIPSEYQKTNYKIIFTVPLIVDALVEEQIRVKFGAKVMLSFGLLQFESNVKGHVQCKPVYNRALKQLELNLLDVDLEKIKMLGFIVLPSFLVESIEEVISAILQTELTGMNNIPVSPIIGSLELPDMPKGNKYKLPVGFGDVSIIDDNTIVLGFDIEVKGEGKKTPKTNSNFDGDLVIGLSRSAINKVINFWWSNTTYEKNIQFRGRIPIKNVDKLIDYLSNYSIELIPKLFTLGFVEIDWNLMNLWFDYEGTVVLAEPEITFDADSLVLAVGSEVDLTAHLRVDLKVSLDFDTSGPIPDALTPWKDDRTVGSTRRVFDLMRYHVSQKQVRFVDKDAKLLLDDKQRVVLEFGGFDLDLGLNWRLPRRMVRRMEKNIEKQIKVDFPRIPVSPSIIRQKIEDTDITLELFVKEIRQRKNAIQVKANIEYKKD